MRKLLVLASFLAACGGGSSGGGGGPVPLNGTVGGRAFGIDANGQNAIVASSGATPCQLTLGSQTVNAGIKAIALHVTSYASGCGDFSNTGCTLHQNAQSVTVIFARIVPPSLTQPNPDVTNVPLASTGTAYTINADPTVVTPDGTTGYLYATYALDVATPAGSCNAGTPPAVTGGTITFGSVAGPITGHVAVTFANGDSLQGDFSATVCGGSGPDVCSIASSGAANPLCPNAPTCVP